MTQLELAEELNVSRQAVSRWEQGALGVHVDAHPMAAALVHRVAGELLDGVQGLPPVADELAEELNVSRQAVSRWEQGVSHS